VQTAETAIFDHCQSLNARLAEHDAPLGFACVIPQHFAPRSAQFAATIKGLRSLESMQSALNTIVAEQKIAADADYRRMEANIGIALAARERFHLFPDMQHLIESKSPDDLRNLITARIADAERAERERQEQEDRRRLDAHHGLAHAEAELQRTVESRLGAHPQVQQLAAVYAHADDTNVARIDHSEHHLDMVPPDNDTLIKLGDITAAIAPLSITADGLKQLGFEPAATDKSAKLYRQSDLYAIFCKMASHLNDKARRARPQWRAGELSKQAA